MDDLLLYANGIDGSTGRYLFPPLPMAEAERRALSEDPRSPLIRWFQEIRRRLTRGGKELPPEVDPTDPRQAGWAIVFRRDEDAGLREALQGLVERRRSQADDPRLVQMLQYSGESAAYEWLARQQVPAGQHNLYRVPYYLLLAGSPARIPFEFGFQLSSQYAVGRLPFDTADACAAYADQLRRYEEADALPNARQIAYYATCHADDVPTESSMQHLVNPLVFGVPASDRVPAVPSLAEEYGFESCASLGEQATRQALSALLASGGGESSPALLFTAGHGVAFPRGDARQRPHNGALVSQSWSRYRPIARDDYFAGEDLPGEACLRGLISFHFACYGGGTPEFDRFAGLAEGTPHHVADQAFCAALPVAMLTHPRGGALACVGHVDSSKVLSVHSERAGSKYMAFRHVLARLMKGEPVGHAVRTELARLAADLSLMIAELQQDARLEMPVAPLDLVASMIERNDAGSYVVLGDPAARLRVEKLGRSGVMRCPCNEEPPAQCNRAGGFGSG